MTNEALKSKLTELLPTLQLCQEHFARKRALGVLENSLMMVENLKPSSHSLRLCGFT